MISQNLVLIKMFIFVLPMKKRLVSFWTLFQISRQPRRIRQKKTTKRAKIFADAGVSF